MAVTTLLLTALALTGVHAQTSSRTTYTGCSTELIDGSAIYGCFGPDGARTPFSTMAISTPASTTASAAGRTAAVTDCTASTTDDVRCVNGVGSTVRVLDTPTATDDVPAAYTNCHAHGGGEVFCFSPDGEDVAVVALGAEVTSTASPSVQTTSGFREGQRTAVTDCTATATNDVRCVNGAGSTVQVLHTPTAIDEVPPAYTNCHAHGADEQFCFAPGGEDVAVLPFGAEASTGRSCHFHGPVEHCVGGDETEEARDCGMSKFSYNVGLRVGMIFVILITSGIGVFAPIIITKLPLSGNIASIILQMLKQFGTGIIISTAFIHLWSHAQLYLSNECITWPVYYEGTTSAIVIAGLFLSFLIDYIAHRIVGDRERRKATTNADSSSATSTSAIETPKSDTPLPYSTVNDGPHNNNPLLRFDHHTHSTTTPLSVTLMEAGILFHSILIGLTLSVTPDTYFSTLLIVIIFHQFFEGLALGSRITLLPAPSPSTSTSLPRKFLLALAFTLITPLGMAIGLGVLNSFNGNDPSTMVVFGTLNAVSAGILLWVGVVDMWARDWVVEGGEMTGEGWRRTAGGMGFLVLGMVGMGVLGKWA